MTFGLDNLASKKTMFHGLKDTQRLIVAWFINKIFAFLNETVIVSLLHRGALTKWEREKGHQLNLFFYKAAYD